LVIFIGEESEDASRSSGVGGLKESAFIMKRGFLDI
jgi:hypothetical protein